MPMSAAMEILQEHMPTHNTVGKKKARTLCSAPKPPKEDGGDVQPGHSDLAWKRYIEKSLSSINLNNNIIDLSMKKVKTKVINTKT